MKLTLTLLFCWSLLFNTSYRGFTISSNTMHQNCLSKENHDLAVRYVQWRFETAKKLSPSQKVLFENGFEVELLTKADGSKAISFSKKGKPIFTVDGTQLSPHHKAKDLQEYNELYCKLIEQAKLANLPQKSHYRYIDGKNNVWEISNGIVEYKPISKELSSSGEYSGGQPFQSKITSDQFLTIQAMLQKALSNPAIHLQNRLMGSGTIIELLTEHIDLASCYLPMKSNEKTAIEDWLHQFKDKH